MIRLFKVKEKQRETAENAKDEAVRRKQTAGELRLHKGLLVYSIHYFTPKFPSFFLQNSLAFLKIE